MCLHCRRPPLTVNADSPMPQQIRSKAEGPTGQPRPFGRFVAVVYDNSLAAQYHVVTCTSAARPLDALPIKLGVHQEAEA